MKKDKEYKSELEKVIEVINKLLDPNGGCPWDLKQTHESLIPYLIEESYEFIHEVEKKNKEGMKDELGDILLQVLLHSRIAEKKAEFGIQEVAQNLKDKLIFRHPHVFGETVNEKIDSDEVLKRWGNLKTKEKIEKGESVENTQKIPDSYLKLPSLMSAYKIGRKTADLEFDWETPEQVLEKVEEEFQEFKDELINEKKNQAKIKEELGDLLFTIAQLARHLDYNPEEILRDANFKFAKRFSILNDLIRKDKGEQTFIKDLPFEEKEEFWAKVKKVEKENGQKS